MATNPRTVPAPGLVATPPAVPTRRISGRVLVRETHTPIAGIHVAVFEVDRGVRKGPANGGSVPRLSAKSVDSFTTRLGSVLTDNDGNFELVIDAEVAKRFGANKLADPVVVVSAPEDSDPKTRLPRPPADRVLHISYLPRWNAGIVEAYVIRIEQDVLDRFGIPSRQHPAPDTSVSGTVDSFGAALQRSIVDRARLREMVKERAVERKRIAQDRAERSTRLVEGLGRIPLRGNPKYFLDHPDNLAKVHDAAVTAGLARIQSYTGSMMLNLTREDLKGLGLTIDSGGKLSGTVQPADLQAMMAKSTQGMDLVRTRDLPLAPMPAPQVAQLLTGPATNGDGDGTVASPEEAESIILDRVVGQIDQLQPAGTIGVRQDLADLKASLKELRLTGGPADATAFHDFHDLQVAFKHVWAHAFSEVVRDQVEAMYKEFTRLYDAAGLEMPPIAAIQDLDSLLEFKKQAEDATVALGGSPTASAAASIPSLDPTRLKEALFGRTAPAPEPAPDEDAQMLFHVWLAFPDAQTWWRYLSLEQKAQLNEQAGIILGSSTPEDVRARAKATGEFIMNHPAAAPGRLATMTIELGKMLAEPYVFDVFAPNTYNFGILVTYRQKWEPGDYQAGNLVATIPLAPGESRKFSKRKVVKSSRAEKEVSRTMQSQSESRSEDNRAEAEIMKKTSTATNFKMSSHGSFNVGIGSIDAGSEFAMDQQQHSASTKKEFHEATLKAAQEYKLERSVEVDTTTATESEESSSGEITNPNNEITVTYLFYELQRQFRISERIHRARPVILVAQDVPGPHQIDEAWLLAHQWILGRVLLDDSLRPALEYLNTGFAGDEVSNEILHATWRKAVTVAEKLEGLVSDQLQMRAALRESLVQTALAKDSVPKMPSALKIFTMGMDPTDQTTDLLEAQRKAAETRLQYVEEALADSQAKLRGATDQLSQAARDYAEGLQRQFSRHTAIDQLRLHVKQNILFYMQAIWDHEPPDQRFFRLYNKPVAFPEPGTSCTYVPVSPPPAPTVNLKTNMLASYGTAASSPASPKSSVNLSWGDSKLAVRADTLIPVQFQTSCVPTVVSGPTRELVEVADLDNPLGYKGNYIIFPLRVQCHLTDFMLREYVDEYFGVRDPDEAGNYAVEDLEALVAGVIADPTTSATDKAHWRDLLIKRLSEARPTSDDIVVPTGHLFIEALPGSHPLLEDFKLLHRAEDVLKVRAEVRHAELENLRRAARLVNGERGDPDVEKKIIVENGVSALIGSE